MATTSVTAAIKAKYESLTASNFPGGVRPPVFFGQAPTVDGTGAQQRPPYVVFTEASRGVVVLDFERNSLLALVLNMEVVANTLVDVDTITNCVRWNSPTAVASGNGFDYGNLPDLAAPRGTHGIVPVSEPRKLTPPPDRNVALVHGCEMAFRVLVLERS